MKRFYWRVWTISCISHIEHFRSTAEIILVTNPSLAILPFLGSNSAILSLMFWVFQSGSLEFCTLAFFFVFLSSENFSVKKMLTIYLIPAFVVFALVFYFWKSRRNPEKNPFSSKCLQLPPAEIEIDRKKRKAVLKQSLHCII